MNGYFALPGLLHLWRLQRVKRRYLAGKATIEDVRRVVRVQCAGVPESRRRAGR